MCRTFVGNKITRGFSESSSPASRDQLSVSPGQAEPCSPDMEGPIALIAPELPEDTLMEVCIVLNSSGFISENFVSLCEVNQKLTSLKLTDLGLEKSIFVVIQHGGVVTVAMCIT